MCDQAGERVIGMFVERVVSDTAEMDIGGSPGDIGVIGLGPEGAFPVVGGGVGIPLHTATPGRSGVGVNPVAGVADAVAATIAADGA